VGGYRRPSGDWVELKELVERAVQGSRVYRPGQIALPEFHGNERVRAPSFEVTGESTQAAAWRLVSAGAEDVLLLNFASARNPGGGFLNGAKAQEEDLMRCSALYPCLTACSEYYEANRARDSMLYTDHMIYTPKAPWFRLRSNDAPDSLFLASVITAPAPKAGQARRRGLAEAEILEALERRAGLVLQLAKERGHRNLVLGAWGCGVFQNEPGAVARSFAAWLRGPFAGDFDRVVFAIYDRSASQANRRAFEAVFLN
jgi:uncharacterized protein (TIGR02452 family)